MYHRVALAVLRSQWNPSSLRDHSKQRGFAQRFADRNVPDGGWQFLVAFTPGARFCFADGSVRFLTASIDPAIYQDLGHRADGAMMGGEY